MPSDWRPRYAEAYRRQDRAFLGFAADRAALAIAADRLGRLRRRAWSGRRGARAPEGGKIAIELAAKPGFLCKVGDAMTPASRPRQGMRRRDPPDVPAQVGKVWRPR